MLSALGYMLSPVHPSARLSHGWISQKTVEVRIENTVAY